MASIDDVWSRVPSRVRTKIKKAIANDVQEFGEQSLKGIEDRRMDLSSEAEAREWALNNPEKARKHAWQTIRQRYGALLAKSMLMTNPEMDALEAMDTVAEDVQKFILLFFNPVIKWGLIVGHKEEIQEDVAEDFTAIGEDAMAVLEMLAKDGELEEEDLPETAQIVLEQSGELAREVQSDD